LIITQEVDENDQLLGFFVKWIDEFKKYYTVRTIALRTPEKNWLLLCFKILWYVPRSDAVFCHMAPIFAVIAGPWARLWRKRIGLWYTHGTVTWKLRLAEKFVNVIFTASPESFRLPSKKVIVTGHGINTELFTPKMGTPKRVSDTLKILSVGRIAPVKHYEVLIEAAEILKQRGVDFTVTIVGKAVLERDKTYEQNMRDKSSGLNFNFTGQKTQSELPEIYRSHDIFIHMSDTGSLDKVLLEAMSCGIRVFSCNDAAKSFLPEWHIFDRDNPEELAGKILDVRSSDFDGRKYVVENHELSKLITKISSLL